MTPLGLRTSRKRDSHAPASGLYERDFFLWTEEQAALLRAQVGGSIGLDAANLAEEIESLGRSQKNELRSRLLVVLLHLLKWRFQPGGRSSGWRGTLVEQRRRIAQALDESPSLRAFPATAFEAEYDTARIKAADETMLPDRVFPARCPFTIEQVLDPDFYPEAD